VLASFEIVRQAPVALRSRGFFLETKRAARLEHFRLRRTHPSSWLGLSWLVPRLVFGAGERLSAGVRLLRDANAYDPDDLAAERDLMAEIQGTLTIAPSDHPLERELYHLLKRIVEQPDTVETYDIDRVLAEAEGIVGPGGVIEYQYC